MPSARLASAQRVGHRSRLRRDPSERNQIGWALILGHSAMWRALFRVDARPTYWAKGGPVVRAEAQAHRGGPAAGGDQPGVGAGEVDPPRAPVDAAPLVGATPLGCRPRSPFRATGRRPIEPPRPLPPPRRPSAPNASASTASSSGSSPWEATRDEAILAEARAEILASTDNNPPPILDPLRRRRHHPTRGPAPRP
jgi:hypothetical protein